MNFPYLIKIPHICAKEPTITVEPFDPEIYQKWMMKCGRMLLVNNVEDEKNLKRNLALFRYPDVIQALSTIGH